MILCSIGEVMEGDTEGPCVKAGLLTRVLGERMEIKTVQRYCNEASLIVFK